MFIYLIILIKNEQPPVLGEGLVRFSRLLYIDIEDIERSFPKAAQRPQTPTTR